ncbi:MAG: alginate lyase family protein [Candidatus Bathyarchaeia archaeon]
MERPKNVEDWSRLKVVYVKQLDDKSLFDEVNLEYEGLDRVREAVLEGDLEKAKIELVRYMKEREKPKPFPLEKGADEQVIAEADRVLEHIFTLVGHPPQKIGRDMKWNEDPVNYDQWAISLNRHYHWITLGRAYIQTKDERYAKEFANQLLSWINVMPVQIGKVYIQGLDDRPGLAPLSLDAGIRMGETWIPAYYYFLHSPSFTVDAHIAMLKVFRDHAIYLMDLKHFRSFSNWGTMESNGLFHIGVMFPEFKKAETWRKTAMERLYGELENQVYPDGVQIELSTGYHQVSLRNFVCAMQIAQMNDVAMPSDYVEKLEKMYNFNLYASMPNAKLPGLNDAGEVPIQPSLAEGFKYFPHRKDFQGMATGGKEGERPKFNSYAFPYAGYLIMRSGWDLDDRYLLFDAGPFGDAHQHEDKLNIVIYAYGKTHIIDPGNYHYDSSKWRKHMISSFAHNVVIVDDKGQHRRGKPRDKRWGTGRAGGTYTVSKPLPLKWISQNGFDYAASTYDEGYGSENDMTVTHTRSILFVKPDYWIVTDQIIPKDDKKHKYESLFHLDAPSAEVDRSNGSVVTKNDGLSNMGILPLFNSNLNVKVVAGQEEPVLRGWIIAYGTEKKVRSIPVAVFEKEETGTTDFLYVFYPIQPTGKLPVKSVEPLVVEAEGATVGAKINFLDDRVHYFAQASKEGAKMKFDRFEGDGEVALVEVTRDGKIGRLIICFGTKLRHHGKEIREGDLID